MPFSSLYLQLLALHFSVIRLGQDLLLGKLRILSSQLLNFALELLLRELIERILADVGEARLETLDYLLVLVHDLIKLALVDEVACLQFRRDAICAHGNLIVLDALIVQFLVQNVDLFSLVDAFLLGASDTLPLACHLVLEDEDAFFKTLDLYSLLVSDLFFLDKLLFKSHLLINYLLLD